MQPSQTNNEPLDVLIIGMGFSGIGAAIKLLESDINNIAIYEKSNGIGGTWHENKYPGAACDVPSHLYCYSFAPNPNWSHVYARQAEIKAYLEKIVNNHFGRDIKKKKAKTALEALKSLELNYLIHQNTLQNFYRFDLQDILLILSQQLCKE